MDLVLTMPMGKMVKISSPTLQLFCASSEILNIFSNFWISNCQLDFFVIFKGKKNAVVVLATVESWLTAFFSLI